MPHRCLALAILVLIAALRVEPVASDKGWPQGKTYELSGLRVTLSAPVLVGRSKDYFWFPQIQLLPNGELIAIIRTCADDWPFEDKSAVLWSVDNGLTWSKPEPYKPESFAQLLAPSGDMLLLPLMVYPRPNGVGGIYHVIPGSKREVNREPGEMIVTGLPKPFLSPYPPQGAVGFIDGQTVKIKDGKYLAPVYAYFKDYDEQIFKRVGGKYLATTREGGYTHKKYNLMAAESDDGIRWKIRSIIADENSSVAGIDGPSESAIVRLVDGRLMCLFGQAKPFGRGKTYGQTWSSDEGKTWTTPVAASGPYGVEPCLVVMKDGTLVLSGGRPGLYLGFNLDGTGKDWQMIDTANFHSASQPKDSIETGTAVRTSPGTTTPVILTGADKHTTGYAEVVAIDDKRLLYIYDRIPNGWDLAPKGSSETFTVWVVQVTLER